MDPYLEPFWLDVHTALVSSTRDVLNSHLPDDLVASAQERVAIESGNEERLYLPDLQIRETQSNYSVATDDETGPANALLPYRLVSEIDPIIERFVTITDTRNKRLVTVIEFVSPTNKRGEGLRAFRSKRVELLASGVSFVEIDLVRAGDWEALLKPHRAQKRASIYRATVRVPRDPAAVYLQPIALQDKLPDLPLPLRRDDPVVKLDLQPLLNSAYDNGRYERRIDYKVDVIPPLEGEDAKWADQMLRAAGKR